MKPAKKTVTVYVSEPLLARVRRLTGRRDNVKAVEDALRQCVRLRLAVEEMRKKQRRKRPKIHDFWNDMVDMSDLLRDKNCDWDALIRGAPRGKA